MTDPPQQEQRGAGKRARNAPSNLSDVGCEVVDGVAREQTKQRREQFHEAATFRLHMEAYGTAMDSKGQERKRVKCVICKVSMFDDMDTIKKHVGWVKGKAEDDADPAAGSYDLCNKHQLKLKAEVERRIAQQGETMQMVLLHHC